MTYIPQNCEDDAPVYAYEEGDEVRKKLNEILPENPNQPYDMHEVIENLIDANSF